MSKKKKTPEIGQPSNVGIKEKVSEPEKTPTTAVKQKENEPKLNEVKTPSLPNKGTAEKLSPSSNPKQVGRPSSDQLKQTGRSPSSNPMKKISASPSSDPKKVGSPSSNPPKIKNSPSSKLKALLSPSSKLKAKAKLKKDSKQVGKSLENWEDAKPLEDLTPPTGQFVTAQEVVEMQVAFYRYEFCLIQKIMYQEENKMMKTEHEVENFGVLQVRGLSSWFWATSLFEKIFWAVTLLTMLSLLLYAIVRTFDDYISNPIATVYAEVKVKELEFPTVYICPLNMINRTRLNEGPIADNDFLEMYSLMPKIYYNDTNILQKISTMWEIIEDLAHCTTNLSRRRTFAKANLKNRQSFESVQNYFMKIGYDVNEFVRECAINTLSVNCSEIVKPILDRNFGKCFSLNLFHIKQRTSKMGLKLLLDIHKELYPVKTDNIEILQSLEGVVVYVDDTFNPAVYKKIFVKSGTYTNVNLQMQKYDVLYWKNHTEPCSDYKHSLSVLMGRYSASLCEMDCIQEFVSDHCNCIFIVDLQFVNPEIMKKKHLSFCSASDLKGCVYEQLQSRKNIKNCRKCGHSCQRTTYKLYTDRARFPSKKALENKSTKFNLSRGMIVLDIAFPDMSYERINHWKSIDSDTFLSTLGGQLDLWYGISLTSIVQALFIIAQVIYFYATEYKATKDEKEAEKELLEEIRRP